VRKLREEVLGVEYERVPVFEPSSSLGCNTVISPSMMHPSLVLVPASAQKETYKQKPGFEAVVEIKAAVKGILEIKAAVEVEAAMYRGRYRSVEVK
jgi:hypothetical protein